MRISTAPPPDRVAGHTPSPCLRMSTIVLDEHVCCLLDRVLLGEVSLSAPPRSGGGLPLVAILSPVLELLE